MLLTFFTWEHGATTIKSATNNSPHTFIANMEPHMKSTYLLRTTYQNEILPTTRPITKPATNLKDMLESAGAHDRSLQDDVGEVQMRKDDVRETKARAKAIHQK